MGGRHLRDRDSEAPSSVASDAALVGEAGEGLGGCLQIITRGLRIVECENNAAALALSIRQASRKGDQPLV